MIRKTFRSVRLSIVREPVEQSYAMTAVRSGGDVREIAVLLMQASGTSGLCRRCGLPMEKP